MILIKVDRSVPSADLCVEFGPSPVPSALGSQQVHADLSFAKEKVGEMKLMHGDSAWRTAVNFADPYSMRPSQRRVPSRAYFKWVEMAPLLGAGVCRGPVLHLCEAPGGFVQAHWDMHQAEWEAHSVEGKDCIRFKRMPPRGKVLSGIPMGGDLLSDGAFLHMLSSLPRKYSVVTADGSVDFESQHSRAEECNFLLALRQAMVARMVLVQGGSLVLKLFDMATEATWGLVQLLTDWFEVVRISKPASSRCSNGECYAVCTGARETYDSDAFRALEGVKDGKVARLYASLDPTVVRDLSRPDLPSSQLSALRRAIGVCTGKSCESVDFTREWWQGPGSALHLRRDLKRWRGA